MFKFGKYEADRFTANGIIPRTLGINASRTTGDMDDTLHIRPIERSDYDGWRPLWDAYNAFYGRVDATALRENITASTWERFFSPDEPVHALVAEYQGQVVGFAHYLFHRSTTRLDDVCYLQDLLTDEGLRGKGIGRRLVLAVYDAARRAGSSRVYWQTQSSNAAGRALYDKIAQHKGFIVYASELS
jgi:GNAT superfamily N-acetyltransferase